MIYSARIIFIPLEQKNLESHKKVCESKNFCNVIIPSQDSKILEFNQYQKSYKVLFFIYAVLGCIIKKINGCKNNPGSWSTTKGSEHNPSGFSMSTISSFRSIKNKHDVCRVKDSIKNFSEFLTENAAKIILKWKKLKFLINKRAAGIIQKCKKYVIFPKKNLKNRYSRDEKYHKVRDHYHYKGNIEVLRIAYVI